MDNNWQDIIKNAFIGEVIDTVSQKAESNVVDEYANKKVEEYKKSIEKPKAESKIMNTSLIGVASALSTVAAWYGFDLSAEDVAAVVTTITLITNGANYYFRRYKTSAGIK